jgi:hypothetical protein
MTAKPEWADARMKTDPKPLFAVSLSNGPFGTNRHRQQQTNRSK